MPHFLPCRRSRAKLSRARRAVAELQTDSTSAEAFAKNTAQKTTLKHIDQRQSWVKTLRDRTIITPVHVDTNRNIADVFTKILIKKDFEALRDMMMIPCVRSLQCNMIYDPFV